ncbi:MAG: hypothetical protein ACRC9L_06245 [Brevinema sp.]
MKKNTAVCLCTMFFLTNCGATVRSSQGGFVRQTVVARDSSNKKLEGISVYVNGSLIGQTDAKGNLKHEIAAPIKGDKIKVRLEKEGYIPVEKEIVAVVDGGFITGDIFLGLLGFIPLAISLTVDGVTEGWLAYPRTVTLTLQPK